MVTFLGEFLGIMEERESMISCRVTVVGSDAPSDYHVAARSSKNPSHGTESAQPAPELPTAAALAQTKKRARPRKNGSVATPISAKPISSAAPHQVIDFSSKKKRPKVKQVGSAITVYQPKVDVENSGTMGHLKGKEIASSSTSTPSKRSCETTPPQTKRRNKKGGSKNPTEPIPPPRVKTIYGLKYVKDWGRDWYKKFKLTGYINERAVNESLLQKNFPTIHQAIHEMGWTSVFQHPGPANLDLVLELYANMFAPTRGQYHDTVDLRGKEIVVNKTTLCEVLGVPDHPIEPLNDFIDRPDYKAMRELLCGPSSSHQWTRRNGKNRTHKCMIMGKFQKPARVWLKLINHRIRPLDHYSTVTRERACMIYFFMTGQPVNLGYWMLKEIVKTRDNLSKRLHFANTLTTLVMKRFTDIFDPRGDRVIAAPTETVDISNVQAPDETPKAKLTPAEEREGQANLLARMHAMMEWQCRQAGMDFTALDARFPLSTISKQIIGGRVELPEDEDMNTVDLMSSASEDGEGGDSHIVDDSEDEDEEAGLLEDGEKGESPVVVDDSEDEDDEAGSP